MLISASVKNAGGRHVTSVCTGDISQTLEIKAKPDGKGSAINGGELLLLALATCYCNDLYREAQRLGIPLEGIDVSASAEFDGIGLAAKNIRYRASVTSSADSESIERLLRETDVVAEIHNTVRAAIPVTLVTGTANA